MFDFLEQYGMIFCNIIIIFALIGILVLYKSTGSMQSLSSKNASTSNSSTDVSTDANNNTDNNDSIDDFLLYWMLTQ